GYLTFHSWTPADHCGCMTTSRRRAFVVTGSKRTVLYASFATPYSPSASTGFQSPPSLHRIRHDFGTRTSPRPVSSNQYSWTSETRAGCANAYSIHSVVPFAGHQSKYDEASFDALGSSPSFTPRGFLRPEVVTVLVVARVGYGLGRALASVRGIQPSISPRPRFAQVAYGIATMFCSVLIGL